MAKRREIDLEKGIQKCNTCGEWKPLEEFTKHRKMKHGINTRCLNCSSKIINEKYREKDLEKKREQGRKWYNKNKEKILNNRNKEKIRAWFREYDKTPERKLKKKHYDSKRRALEISQSKDTDITFEYLKELKENTFYCEECGNEMNDVLYDDNQYNLDHIIPLSKGGKHTKNNVRYICRKCNIKKSNNIIDKNI